MWRHLLCLALILLLVGIGTGCADKTKEAESIYLALEGESPTWAIEDYEVYTSAETTKSGRGTLKMKNEEDDETDFISVKVFMKTEDKEISLGSTSVDGATGNLATKGITTVTLEREGPLFINGKEPVEPDDIDEIFAIVTWADEEPGGDAKERIELYEKDENLIMDSDTDDL